jgi:hypothetical protein
VRLLRVVSFVSYVSYTHGDIWDRAAIGFVKKLKVSGCEHSHRRNVQTNLWRLDTVNSSQAIEWFSRLAAEILAIRNLSVPIVLVPMPDSNCDYQSANVSKVTRLAQGIADCMTSAVVCDVLRWSQKMKPSHNGGTRNPQELYDRLVLTGPVARGTCVLVDDIYTTGSHLCAAAARISQSTMGCREALCVGRAVTESQDQPFSIVEEVLANFPRQRTDKFTGRSRCRLEAMFGS